ncbi:alpha/beta fold hydrolase [Ligilactobacillus sp. LYQ60]|uniref:alpha/beta fold hydrolase n=1 Tax=Ligilactobacillus sp. LYQ60 TaxID=3378799 RepID=UPI0038545A78
MITYQAYGNSKKPVLCLLPGAGLGAWAYQQIIPLISKNFYIIIPDVLPNFTTMTDASQQLHELITAKFQGHIQTLAGLSIGAQIALNLISSYPTICTNLLLESCAAFPQPIHKVIKPLTSLSYSLTRFTQFNRLQAAALHLPSNEYSSYDQEVKSISKQTLINTLTANTTFDARKLIPIDFNGKTFIVYGTSEKKIIIKSSHYLLKNFRNAKIIPLTNYYHGELTLTHPVEFTQMINKLNNYD